MKVLKRTHMNGHESFLREYRVNVGGQVFGKRSDKPLTQRIHSNGYAFVDLSTMGHSWRCYVDVLVALAHIPRPQGANTIIHLDGNALNNAAPNLAWENPAHGDMAGCCLECGRPWPDVFESPRYEDKGAQIVARMKTQQLPAPTPLPVDFVPPVELSDEEAEAIARAEESRAA